MSETGATPEQIDAAAQCRYRADHPDDPAWRWDRAGAATRDVYRRIVAVEAGYLVLPGSAIVSPEQRASVLRVAAALETILAYDAAQTGPAGIQAAHFAANRAMAALRPGDIEAAKAIGGQN